MTGRLELFLVGQAPGRHPRHDPERHALFPYPPGCTGAKLREMMGLSMRDYIRIPRRNVIARWPGPSHGGDAFPMSRAREGASDMMTLLWGRDVVFVGAQTAKAFRLSADPMVWTRDKTYNWCVVPHPSGRNRWYNDEENRRAAEAFLSDLGARWRLQLETDLVEGACTSAAG